MTDKPWTQTYSGKAFTLPAHHSMFDIIDIAHGLSNQCRYVGATHRFYSVAEHSILLSRWLNREYKDPELAKAALMHDATEAYLGDVARPIKQFLPTFIEIETQVDEEMQGWLEAQYGLQCSMQDKRLKEADLRICMDEKAQLMAPEPQPWEALGGPLNIKVYGFGPAEAKALFLTEFRKLYGNVL